MPELSEIEINNHLIEVLAELFGVDMKQRKQ